MKENKFIPTFESFVNEVKGYKPAGGKPTVELSKADLAMLDIYSFDIMDKMIASYDEFEFEVNKQGNDDYTFFNGEEIIQNLTAKELKTELAWHFDNRD